MRDAIVAGTRNIEELLIGGTGEIPARIVEEDGRILIRKECDKHGAYEDVISIDPKLSQVLEGRVFGRDFRTAEDTHVHRHGTSTIRYGRGAVLTVDLTNRCNMMCNPCFMDANQVGYVHELTLDEIRRILDDSISFKPRRQLYVQFSGGEPTMSPHFLEACHYAKEIGYWSVQAASNGLRFMLEPEFAQQAKEAGLNMVYLQFDGVTAFFDIENFVRDIDIITDTARGVGLSKMQALLAFVRNLDQRNMPPGMTIPKFLKLLNRKMGATMSSSMEEDEWNIMWVGGMWFQDLWTYDFRRTEMCVIPYATQEGEISFCAYNTGVGWRKIVENMHMVAETRDWFRDKGRHQIYAGDRLMALGPEEIRLPVIQPTPHPGTVQLGTGCGH